MTLIVAATALFFLHVAAWIAMPAGRLESSAPEGVAMDGMALETSAS
jgi:hypothetical protein